jgi:5-methylcytosine-specific restriction endonuclease McrA
MDITLCDRCHAAEKSYPYTDFTKQEKKLYNNNIKEKEPSYVHF